MAAEIKIGRITHFFGKIMVAAIELSGGDLSAGDRIRIKGHTSDFSQDIDSMQIERADVPKASKGQSVGIRVVQPARVGDEVFKVVG